MPPTVEARDRGTKIDLDYLGAEVAEPVGGGGSAVHEEVAAARLEQRGPPMRVIRILGTLVTARVPRPRPGESYC